jgi:hypothetical protein
MKKSCAVALLMLGCSSAAAVDSSLSPFAGHWGGEMAACGPLSLDVANVRPDGAVVGTVDCPKLGIVRTIGDRVIHGKQLRGWIVGESLHLEGDNAVAHVTFEAGKLIGFVRIPLKKDAAVVLIRR